MMSPRGSVAGDDASGDCVKVTEMAGPSAVFAMKLWYPSISRGSAGGGVSSSKYSGRRARR